MEVFGVNDSKLVRQPTDIRAKETPNVSHDKAMYKTPKDGVKVYTGAEQGVKIRLGASLAEMQRTYIEGTLRKYGGDKDKAAKALGVKKSVLSKKLRGGKSQSQSTPA
jgi:DNA-binding NtrC family response regulator